MHWVLIWMANLAIFTDRAKRNGRNRFVHAPDIALMAALEQKLVMDMLVANI